MEKENIEEGLTFEQYISFLRQIWTYHNNCLEIARKLLVYFPPQPNERSSTAMMLFNSLPDAEKDSFIELMKSRAATEEEEPGS